MTGHHQNNKTMHHTTTNRFLVTSLILLTVHLPIINSQDNWFCGNDYTDASAKCMTPCPSGAGCPTGEECFSGTTCDTSTSYCGVDANDANTRCGTPCPTGSGCPYGEACFLGTSCGSSSSSSSSSIGGNSWSDPSSTTANVVITSTGIDAVEESFQAISDTINNKLFLYETPLSEWLPSSVYRFDGFFEGLKVMHQVGVAGTKIYMGGDCAHCHMYGLVNIAAFLAQAMKETM